MTQVFKGRYTAATNGIFSRVPDQMRIHNFHTASNEVTMIERADTDKVAGESRQLKHEWGVILAGGDGTRLKSLTRKITGDERPKQFCSCNRISTAPAIDRSVVAAEIAKLLLTLVIHLSAGGTSPEKQIR